MENALAGLGNPWAPWEDPVPLMGYDIDTQGPLHLRLGLEPKHLARIKEELRDRLERVSRVTFRGIGTIRGFDPRQAGWQPIVAEDDPEGQALLKALEPLCKRRGALEPLTYRGANPYAWAVAQGLAVPRLPITTSSPRLPLFLVLVGSPDKLPFSLQLALQDLGLTGRLWFPTPEAAAAYAERVIAVEDAAPLEGFPKVVSLVPGHDPGDPAWMLAAFLEKDGTQTHAPMTLREPPALAPGRYGIAAGRARPHSRDEERGPDTGGGGTVHPEHDGSRDDRPGGAQSTEKRPEAASDALGRFFDLARRTSRALVLMGGHGACVSQNDERRKQWQGAPFVRSSRWTTIPPDELPNSCFSGSLLWWFGCFGAGTEATCPYAPLLPSGHKEKRAFASYHNDKPFLSAFAVQALARKDGPLAVLGNIGITWKSSLGPIADHGVSSLLSNVGSALRHGMPVGAAASYLWLRAQVAGRHAQDAVTSMLAGDTGSLSAGLLAWVYRLCLERFVVLGDPACRLPVAGGGKNRVRKPLRGLMAQVR